MEIDDLEVMDLLDRQQRQLSPMWRSYIYALLSMPTLSTWEDAYLAPIGGKQLWDAVVDTGYPVQIKIGKFWPLVPSRTQVLEALREHALPSPADERLTR